MADFSSEKTSEINQSQSKLQDDLTKNITALTLKFTDFTDKIRTEVKENDKEIISNFQKQLEDFNDHSKQQSSSLTISLQQITWTTTNGEEINLKSLLQPPLVVNQMEIIPSKAKKWYKTYCTLNLENE